MLIQEFTKKQAEDQARANAVDLNDKDTQGAVQDPGAKDKALRLSSKWTEVPDRPTKEDLEHEWFLEIFAGEAGITKAIDRIQKYQVLPPIDIEVTGAVESSTDIFDKGVRKKIHEWINAGAIKLVHFGTPCTTYSSARKNDGGPPPLRSRSRPRGLPGITGKLKEQLDEGTAFLDITLEIMADLDNNAVPWTLENPASSIMWHDPRLQEATRRAPCAAQPRAASSCRRRRRRRRAS